MFPCTKCGACCRNVKGLGLPCDDDGVCTNLIQDDNTCSMYEDRPLICRVRDYGKSINKDKDGDLKDWYIENRSYF